MSLSFHRSRLIQRISNCLIETLDLPEVINLIEEVSLVELRADSLLPWRHTDELLHGCGPN